MKDDTKDTGKQIRISSKAHKIFRIAAAKQGRYMRAIIDDLAQELKHGSR